MSPRETEARLTADEFTVCHAPRPSAVDESRPVRVAVPDRLPSAAELSVFLRTPTMPFTKALAFVGEGVRVVVVLDTEKPAVGVFGDDAPPQSFFEGDELTLPDVLPGFAVPVSRLFA